jgi:hypothetical protein
MSDRGEKTGRSTSPGLGVPERSPTGLGIVRTGNSSRSANKRAATGLRAGPDTWRRGADDEIDSQHVPRSEWQARERGEARVLLCAGNAAWFIGPPIGREGRPPATAVCLVFLGACALKKLEPDAERCPRAR